jgi:hypothetical protein
MLPNRRMFWKVRAMPACAIDGRLPSSSGVPAKRMSPLSRV